MALSQEQLDAIEAQLNTIRGSVSDITQQYKATGNTSPTSDYTALQSASDIKQQPAFQYNETAGTEPDISGSVADIAGYKASTKSLQDSIARFQAQYEANQKQSESILDKISGKKSVSDYQTEIKNQLGYDPEQYLADRQTDIAEIESLQKTYETALQSKQMALLNDQSQAATTGFVNKAMNRTEKEWNIKLNGIAGAINTKNAIISLKDQSYEKATDYINKAVENYTAELKNEVDQYEQLRQDNAELLAEMSDVDMKIFDAAESRAKQEYETAQTEKTQIGKLMTDYPDAPWTTNSMGLTLAEAAQIAAKSAKYQAEVSEAGPEQWSAPYMMGGDYVQENLKTGEIRTAVNISTKDDPNVTSLADAIILDPAKYNDLTPTQKGNVISELAARGYDTTQLKSSAFMKATSAAQASFNSAVALLDQVAIKASNAITAENPWETIVQQAKGAPFISRFNPDTKVYQDTIASFVSTLARAVGEKGVLTDYDIDRVKKALPQLNDTTATATEKLRTFKSLLEGIKNGTADAYTAQQYGLTIKEQASQPSLTKQGEGTTLDAESARSKYNY